MVVTRMMKAISSQMGAHEVRGIGCGIRGFLSLYFVLFDSLAASAYHRLDT